ncbi:MAG TPA: aminotransferase class I/II-fold pyridoxal phosphate-dependent enzyme [Blastocatellia bacterium]|nr:aminotransferase class I/II-fold pyridoxal phosphate-dependent enzyme [Blastocatellia bacterium]
MKLNPFLLDQWLNKYQFSDPPVRYDLAASTGPVWTLKELTALFDDAEREHLNEIALLYTPNEGTKELRSALAAMQGVEPEEIQIVTGVAEALLVLFFLAAEPGANVILPLPGFPPFIELPRSFGIETRLYHVRRENGFQIDPDEIKRLADSNTKLILVNSPHNPTGSVMSSEELRLLHDFALERGIPFVVDEVYHPIYHGTTPASAAELPNATVLGDFSKAFCLSGLRIGWMVERDLQRIQQYCRARSYFTVSNTPHAEALASAAIRHREQIFRRANQVVSANLDLLNRFFEENQDVLGWIRPAGGMTGFPWLLDGADSHAFCENLAERGVLLAPGDCFGVPDHFRIGFGATSAGFQDALDTMAQFIRDSYASARSKSA